MPILSTISERNALKKANEAFYQDDATHIGTRYTSLGHYYCQITILSDEKPVPENQADFNNLKVLFEQMSEEQIFEIAKTLKFTIHYAKHDPDYYSNSDEEEVHLILMHNVDFKHWASTHPGLKFIKAYIIGHSRSKLTGSPLPERVFNKMVVKINVPKVNTPIELN